MAIVQTAYFQQDIIDAAHIDQLYYFIEMEMPKTFLKVDKKHRRAALWPETTLLPVVRVAPDPAIQREMAEILAGILQDTWIDYYKKHGTPAEAQAASKIRFTPALTEQELLKQVENWHIYGETPQWDIICPVCGGVHEDYVYPFEQCPCTIPDGPKAIDWWTAEE